MERITLGNTSTEGFVNFVSEDGRRIVLGTGSYQTKQGDRVFKSSVTVFLHETYAGLVPEKGDLIRVSGDLSVAERKKDPGKIEATYSVRFPNQLEKVVRKGKTANADEKADSADDGDI